MNFTNELAEPHRQFRAYFSRWKDWRGRSTRSEYWAAFLLTNVLGAIAGTVLLVDPYGVLNNIVFILVVPVAVWLGLANCVRRLRDAGLPVAILLVSLVPLGGFLLFILLGTLPSKSNQIMFK